jgi:hypothetical protein
LLFRNAFMSVFLTCHYVVRHGIFACFVVTTRLSPVVLLWYGLLARFVIQCGSRSFRQCFFELLKFWAPRNKKMFCTLSSHREKFTVFKIHLLVVILHIDDSLLDFCLVAGVKVERFSVIICWCCCRPLSLSLWRTTSPPWDSTSSPVVVVVVADLPGYRIAWAGDRLHPLLEIQHHHLLLLQTSQPELVTDYIPSLRFNIITCCCCCCCRPTRVSDRLSWWRNYIPSLRFNIILLFKMFIALLQYYLMTQSQWVH